MRDYLKTFEKVYVIVPSNRVSDVRKYIPESCGIISYRVMENKEVIFSYKKKAQKNVCKIEQCIESLSSNDLSQMLKLVGKDDHQTRSEKIMALLQITQRKPSAPLRPVVSICAMPCGSCARSWGISLPRGICSCKTPARCAVLISLIKSFPVHKSAC